MKKSIKASPFMADVILTTLTSILTIVSLIVVTRLLAEGLGPDKFGVYSLVRRILSTIEPFSTVCMGIALSRYLAMSDNAEERARYFITGICLVLMSCLIISAVGVLFKLPLTRLVFHSDQYQSVFLSMLFLIGGYSFFIALYSYYRGVNQMQKANFWQMSVMAILPIFIIIPYAQSGRVDFIIFLLGLCFFSSIFPLGYLFGKAVGSLHGGCIQKRSWIVLLKYSLPRIPSQFAFAGIFMIGPFLAPYYGSIKDAGYLVVSQSLLRVIEGGVEGFSRVVLPAVARMISEGQNEFLVKRITDLIAFIFHVGLFATLHLYIWIPDITVTWLGQQYADVIPIMQTTVLAVIPFIAYSMMRSIIDAVEEKAINTNNLFIAFLVSLAASLVFAWSGLGAMGLTIAMLMGFFTLGILTVRFVWISYQVSLESLLIFKTIYVNIALLALAIYIKSGLETIFSSGGLICSGFVLEFIFFFLYCLFFFKSSVNWPKEVINRIVLK